MTDLLVENATMTQAQAALKAAADSLSLALRAVRGLDDQVVGPNAVQSMLGDANSALGTNLQIIGQALTDLAASVGQSNASFGDADQDLSRSLGDG